MLLLIESLQGCYVSVSVFVSVLCIALINFSLSDFAKLLKLCRISDCRSLVGL